MSRFVFEPHQLPPDCNSPLDAPADAVGEVGWEGQQRPVLLRVVRAWKFAWLVFAKAEESDDVRVAIRFSKFSPLPMVWHEKPTSQKLLRIAHQISLRPSLDWAPLFCDASIENGPQCVVKMRSGRGFWLDQKLEVATEFRLKTVPLRDSRAWHSAWEKEFQLPDSDVRFAWDWAQMSHEERERHLFDGAGEAWELERVMRLVMLVADSLWRKGAQWRWFFSLNLSYTFLLRLDIVPTGARVATSDEPILELWRDFLANHFQPLQYFLLFQSHPGIRRADYRFSTGVFVDVTQPSHHERLEACLLLREWLEGKASADEIERLLGDEK